MKNLIINADDFGMSHAVNIAIKNCFNKGVLDSATIMVNMPGFNEAVKIANENSIPTGLHFNLTLGNPIAKNVDTLINQNGNFYSRREFVKRYFLKKIDIEHIKIEFLAQIKVFKQHLQLDHIDSHQHIHMLPKIFDEIASYCVKENYPLRITKQFYSKNTKLNKKIRAKLLSLLVSRATKKWGDKLSHNDYLASVFDVLGKDRKPRLALYKEILDNLPSGKVELMVHPVISEINEASNQLTRISDISEIEYKILMSEDFMQILMSCNSVRTLYSAL
jgi:predicted glycoside hydrolase/deacetylase ChbG (UPF0249 family)